MKRCNLCEKEINDNREYSICNSCKEIPYLKVKEILRERYGEKNG